jgi:hypothetical protein
MFIRKNKKAKWENNKGGKGQKHQKKKQKNKRKKEEERKRNLQPGASLESF